jgi:hypothetical protein
MAWSRTPHADLVLVPEWWCALRMALQGQQQHADNERISAHLYTAAAIAATNTFSDPHMTDEDTDSVARTRQIASWGLLQP